MAKTQPSNASGNGILSQLSRQDFQLLQPHLAAVDLPVRKQLTARGKRIDDVYFLETGIASVVGGGNAKQIEIGIIGREGMTGLAVVLGVERALHDTFMQIAGKGLRVSTAKLRELNDQSRTLHRSLLVYVHAYLMQIAQTALANGLGKIEERLARWLLMAADRLDTDELPLTHEFLAATLGTQRPGVTIALHELERAGLIVTQRGRITILDRKALEKSSNGIYLTRER
ncbi:MAG: Crp/Fnr family transcriptional regulator [Hyphomicrobiaceae bacterium]